MSSTNQTTSCTHSVRLNRLGTAPCLPRWHGMTDRNDTQSAQDHEQLSTTPMDRRDPPEPVTVFEPAAHPAPLVFDAPHSGRHYPEDFGHIAGIELLMGGEDRFVDELVADAPAHGVTLVVANFARTYIDPNRRLSDIDTVLLDGDWHEEPAPTIMSERGVGLVFRLIGDGTSIYDRKLTAADITNASSIIGSHITNASPP